MVAPVAQQYTFASGATAHCGRLGPRAGTGVTVNNFPDNTLKQRRINDAYPFELSGFCTGNPSLIQWRLVDWYTGVPRTDWATLIENPASTWRATVQYPRGGMDIIQIRDGVNTALTSATTTRTGVGIFVACYGQSNMANMRSAGGGKRPLGDPRAFFLNSSNVIERVGNINDLRAPNTESDETGYATGGGYISDVNKAGDGFVYLGNLIAQAMNCPVVLIESAQIGQTAAQLTKPTAHWNNHEARLRAVGGDFEICVMSQGESDAVNKTTAQQVAAWRTIRNDHLAINRRNSNSFRMFFLGLGPGSYNGSVEGDFGKMRDGARLMGYETACGYAASAHNMYTVGDPVHFNGVGFSDVYRRVARTICNWLGAPVASGAGPEATTASRSGLDVTINVQHAPGASGLMDGAGGSATALRGFLLHDAGAGGYMTASFATSVMTVTVAPPQPLVVGMLVSGNNVPPNTYISSFGTGTGGTGTYNLSTTPGTISATRVIASIGVTSTAIASSTAFRLTMATAPVGALSVSYAMMNAPHNLTLAEGGVNAAAAQNLPVAASIPCDNAAYYRSGGIGCPLRPFAAISVTG